jgi:small conductance mechanosensitive channel
VGGWLKTLALSWLEPRIDPTWRTILAQVVRVAPLLLVAQTVLEGVGIPATSYIAGISTIGLAVALSLKDSLSNAASGAILLTTAPFRVGDNVTIAGVKGIVKRVGFLTTVIDTPDGRRVTVTNDRILADNIERHGIDGHIRFEVSVRFPKGRIDDTVLAALCAAAAEETPGMPVPEALPTELDPIQGVRVTVRSWCVPEQLLAKRIAVAMALGRVVGSAPDA